MMHNLHSSCDDHAHALRSRVAQDEAEVAITPPLLPGYPNMTAHWRSLPICQGLIDKEEVPPLLPGPFGPIGWNGWGEKQHRQ